MTDTGLASAVEELYATGWSALDSTGCEHLADGKEFPGLVRVGRECASLGFELSISYVQLFDCYRAVWSDSNGNPAGAVVGSSEREAAIYALARLRQKLHAGVSS